MLIRLGRWDRAAGRWFIWRRIWWGGYRWTPFCRVTLRYVGMVFQRVCVMKDGVENGHQQIKRCHDRCVIARIWWTVAGALNRAFTPSADSKVVICPVCRLCPRAHIVTAFPRIPEAHDAE